MMKRLIVAMVMCAVALWSFADGSVVVKSVTAQQRYPWNGLVDIVVMIEGSAADVADADCFFAATNSATLATVPITSITQNGADTGFGTTWMRRFIWNATNDVGEVKIDDLTVCAFLLGGVQLWENGPYWAECNVGATKPEEYGYYFWWGDTVGYKRDGGTVHYYYEDDDDYYDDDYYYSDVTWASSMGVRMPSSPFTEASCLTLNKDSSQLQSAGYIDSVGNLVAAHDSATAHLGAPWRMPTAEERSELMHNCDSTWTTRNGVYGRLVTGRGSYASRSIFLPAAGIGSDSRLGEPGSKGFYWVSTSPKYGGFAQFFSFDSDGRYEGLAISRSAGLSVRPLRGFANGMTISARAGVTTHLKLDCRTVVRTCYAEGELLRYDASWYENGDEVRITDNGTVVATGTAGIYEWHPESGLSSQHILKLEVLADGQVVGSETAEFEYRPPLDVKSVIAYQRYPWNGLVDIVMMLEGSADDVVISKFTFVATNTATHAAVPITSIAQNGSDTGSGTTWTRRYIWNAVNDVGEVKIDDLALTVGAKVFGGVQLWEHGPYWAEYNVGASRPEEYGYYFWWGDTVGYKRNSDNNGWISVKDGVNYSFSSENCQTYGKSNTQLQSEGYIDSTGNLVAACDAATAYRGAPWRMPTDAEFDALISNCDTTWAARGGVNGRLVTGRGAYASKSIFLPVAGYGNESDLYYPGLNGFCWSSTPDSGNPNNARYLLFYSSCFDWFNNRRYCGRSVRPLRGFANGPTVSALAGVTTHLKLDCRTGVHACSADGESLRYDASWYANGDEARIMDNGAVIATGIAGVHTLQTEPCSTTSHLLTLEILSGGQVIGTEIAEFESEATLAHTEVVTTAARAATCMEAGCTKGARCGRCNAVLAVSKILPALGHIEVVTTAARAATCAEAGCTKGSYCSRCNAVLATSEVLSALGHTEVITTVARAATCTEDGCTKASYCKRCKAILATSEKVPNLGGHSGAVTKAAVEPTSVLPGSTAEIRCSRCNELLQASEVIPALGYVRNVTARQLWPHKKVEVCYTLADDIGEVVKADGEVVIGEAAIVADCDSVCWKGASYDPAVWSPSRGNQLSGLTGVFSGTRFTETGHVYESDPISRLTDGVVNGAAGFGNTFAIKSGTLTWELNEPTALSLLRVNTHWPDGGRDGVNITSVAIRQSGSSTWQTLPNSKLSYGMNDDNTSGSLQVVYSNPRGTAFATDVVAVRFSLGLQDNSGSGFTEFEAVKYEPVSANGIVLKITALLCNPGGTGITTPSIANTSSYKWTQSGTTWESGGKGVKSLSSSYITCSVTGPATVSFRWKVSSEAGCDMLHFAVDGTQVFDPISGTVDWQNKTYSLGSGTHTLKWSYTKDGSVNSGSDCGWVDAITVAGGTESFAARTVVGDTSCMPGLHRVVWDMEADGVKVKAEDVKFKVEYGGK